MYYRRRFSKEPQRPPAERRDDFHPLLVYCNWSYAKRYHITLDKLIDAFRNVNKDYIVFYIRMINEVPTRVIYNFVEEFNLEDQNVENILNFTSSIDGVLLRNEFWSDYLKSKEEYQNEKV